MPEISRFYGIVIGMFFDDHNPPHFHVKYAEYQAEIGINNLAIMKGELPPKAMGLVMEWAVEHKQELIKNWHSMKTDRKLSPIKPLK